MDEVETIDLEKLFNPKGRPYVLRVRGDSMVDDHLCDGDYVVVDSRDTARPGEQVVAQTDDGQMTICRWYPEVDNKVRLQKANKTMLPRIVDASSVRVRGVIIGVLRSYA